MFGRGTPPPEVALGKQLEILTAGGGHAGAVLPLGAILINL